MKSSKKSTSPKFSKFLLSGFLLLGALAYVVKFGGPSFLQLYVKAGIGDCNSLSIFCILPDKDIVRPQVDKEYLQGLTKYVFPGMQVYLPKNVLAVQGEISKVYYKKRPDKAKGGVAYMVTQPPGFFVEHYPQVKKAGINNDYEFIARVMAAKVGTINDTTDAFFVVMKSLFTPNLGNQKNAKIIQFVLEDARGFVSYNLGLSENYFDCNMIDGQGRYFKVYIKDKSALIDLKKFFTIISTVRESPQA